MNFKKIIVSNLLLTTCLTSCVSRECKEVIEHFKGFGEKYGADESYKIGLREEKYKKSYMTTKTYKNKPAFGFKVK